MLKLDYRNNLVVNIIFLLKKKQLKSVFKTLCRSVISHEKNSPIFKIAALEITLLKNAPGYITLEILQVTFKRPDS